MEQWVLSVSYNRYKIDIMGGGALLLHAFALILNFLNGDLLIWPE